MKYIIYLRVSLDKQVESGLGIEAQRNLCQKYISDKGNHEFIEFIDDGYSGGLSMEKRPNLLLAISSLEKGDCLIIAKRDRLGRDIIVNAMIESAIKRKKAFLVSASGDFKNDNDPSSILMKRMIDSFSEYERLIIGARTKAAMQVKKSRNERVGYIPYGKRLSKDKIHLEDNEEEQSNLKLMLELREDGMVLRKLAKEMNSMGRLNRLGPWNHLAIYRVIGNNIGRR